jgi:tetratricopeptide (TPR) repeat protein
MSTNTPHTRHDNVKKWEQEGWDALKAENFAKAIQAFDEVFRLDPKNVAAYQGTTAALRKQGKLAEAESLLAAARADHPKHPGILAERAWLSLARKDYDQAIQAFDARLEEPPDDESLLRWRICLLRACGRLAEAERRVEQAESSFPDNLLIRSEHGWLRFSQKKYDKAIAIFQEILAKTPDHDSALQGRVASLRMKGCFKEAARQADDAVSRCPKSPGLYSERAWLHLAQGNFTEAEIDLEVAHELAPKDPYGRLNVARVLVRRSERDDLDAAEQHCRAVLALDPVQAEAIGCLGVIAHKQGRLREAGGPPASLHRAGPR